MASLRWAKQNTTIWYAGWMITVVIGSLLQVLLLSLGGLGKLITLLLLIAGLTLTAILRKRYANSMERIFRFNYKEVESAVRVVFKNKHIGFHRETEEDLYMFKFSWPSLTLTIEDHVYFDIHMNPQPASKVTLHGVNAKNKGLAEMLAKYIDEVDNQGLVQTKSLWW